MLSMTAIDEAHVHLLRQPNAKLLPVDHVPKGYQNNNFDMKLVRWVNTKDYWADN